MSQRVSEWALGVEEKIDVLLVKDKGVWGNANQIPMYDGLFSFNSPETCREFIDGLVKIGIDSTYYLRLYKLLTNPPK